jgi:hypothetical protein
MTPQQIFNYANNYARRAEANGEGTQYPTVRQTAKRFKTTQQAVIDTCEDWQGDGYLGVAVGLRIGSGTYEIESQGDYEVEAYNDNK